MIFSCNIHYFPIASKFRILDSRPTNKKCIMALAQMMQEQYGNQIPDWYGDAVCSATE